jgi:hypothetical protein
MAWNGYRGSESDVGDGWDALENCSLYTKNICRRRLGFGGKVPLSGSSIRAATEFLNYVIAYTSADPTTGNVKAIDQSNDAVSTIATTLSVANWPSMAGIAGRLMIANGVDVKVLYDNIPLTLSTAGLPAPSSAPTSTSTGTGTVTAGLHLIRFRQTDTPDTGILRLSNPSPLEEVTVVAGKTISVAYSGVGSFVIEMTPVGAETFYRVGTATSSPYVINISDELLILNDTAAKYGEFQHEQPPATADIICEHRQRAWMWDKGTKTLYWSRALFPESFAVLDYARSLSLDNNDSPSALISFYSDLYCVGQRSMRRMVYSGDPASAMVIDVPGSFGCFNDRCIAKIDGGIVIGWGQNGAWMIDAMLPKRISDPIESELDTLWSETTVNERFVFFEPIRSEVYFCFPLSGETTCKAAFVYSLKTSEWTLCKWRQGMTAACLNTSYGGRRTAMLFDENGYAWRIGAASNDGGAAGVVTVTSGSTDTIINCSNTATPGQTIYNPTSGEIRVISSSSASAITVSSAFSSAPTTGVVLYVGSIRQRLLTDWNPGDGMNAKKRPTKYLIAVRPSDDMGSIQVNYYTDFSSTKEASEAFAADDFPSGVSIANNQITVDLDTGGTDGLVPVPTPSDWKRVIRAEIIAETPLDGVQFMEAAFRQDQTRESEET